MAEFSSLNGYMVKDETARNIAKGRNQALSYSDYATMIETLNAMDKEEFKVGQNIYIGTVGVPDLWVYSVEPIIHNFVYESDEVVESLLENNVTIQVGYYKLAMLEGQKIDLTTYDARLAEQKAKLEEHDEELVKMNGNFSTAANDIGNAIAAHGIEVPIGSSFKEMANLITTKMVSSSASVVLTGTWDNGLVLPGEVRETTVIFSKTFGQVPKVTLSLSGGGCKVAASNISKTGFTITLTSQISEGYIHSILTTWRAEANSFA